MKVLLNKKSVIEAIGHLKSVAIKRSYMPILTHVKIELSENKTILTATNLDQTLEITLENNFIARKDSIFSACIELSLLEKIVKSAQSEISLELLEDNKASINNAFLNSISVEEMPVTMLDDPKYSASFDYLNNKKALLACYASASDDETRFNLRTLNLDIGGALTSTNGHVLAKRRLSSFVVNSLFDYKRENRSCLISKAFVKTLLRFKSVGTVSIFSGKLAGNTPAEFSLFESINIRLFGRLIDGSFPDCDQVLPKTSGSLKVFNIDSAKLKDLLMTARSFVVDQEKIIRLSIDAENNLIKIEAENANLGEYSNSFNGIRTVGKDLSIRLNANYLLSFIDCLEKNESFNAEFNGELGPVVLRSVKSDHADLNLLMPARI